MISRHPIRIARWFIPGLGVKRWLLVAALGLVLLINGISRWLTAEGMHLQINEAVDNFVDDFFPVDNLWIVFLIVGGLLLFFGIRQWLHSIVDAAAPERKDDIVDALLASRLRRGYKVVTIGGGTGLSTLLRGLKRYTSNITAVVTVSDDGGSSGRLQKELGVLPPGDIRNCLVALADDEALVTDLFQYRFTDGEGLTGHSFGNLFLAAMTGITGNFDTAVKESSRVLNIKGRVLPSTLAMTRLCAELVDGTIVEGESTISQATTPIKRVYLDPGMARPLEEVIEAIRDADAIVLGPGSLFTSILPNLLVEKIAREIEAAHAVKMYVCNVMTQPGETANFTASQHVKALTEIAGARVCDYVVVNDEPPRRLREAYAEEGQVPVVVDEAELAKLGMKTVHGNVMSETQTVRHDSEKLAEIVIDLIDDAVAQRASFVRLTPAVAPSPTSA